MAKRALPAYTNYFSVTKALMLPAELSSTKVTFGEYNGHLCGRLMCSTVDVIDIVRFEITNSHYLFYCDVRTKEAGTS